ncbi:ribosome assembly factor SBDS [Candidatus Woesearchaeota archaeon]|nr:ribosome assembly factor SBDS [Candidatus Woesearchaeota archaeon]
MITVDQAVIAKLKTHGANFEVLVDCNNAIAFKGGKEVDMKDVLATQTVFSDSKKGEQASDVQLKQIFGTTDPSEVAKEVIRKGEIQLTAEYRNRLKETKRKQILDMIHRNGVDPKTHLPHPLTRIELALEEAKIHVDEYTPVQKQVQEILKKIRIILPIKFEVKEVEIKVPAENAGKSYSVINNFGKILKQEWQPDGSLLAVIEIPGGLEQDLYDKLSSITHGNNEVRLLKTK